MLDGMPLVDAHVHAPRLTTLKPAWREWAVEFAGRYDWRSAYSAAGDPVPASPDEASEVLPLGDGAVLALVGPRLPAEDRHLLSAFTAQLGAALTRRRLQEGAAQAARLARAIGRTRDHDPARPAGPQRAEIHVPAHAGGLRAGHRPGDVITAGGIAAVGRRWPGSQSPVHSRLATAG